MSLVNLMSGIVMTQTVELKAMLEVLEDLRGYSGVGVDGNPYDTPSWNAALKAAQEVLLERVYGTV